jgi:hypothetical protein
MWLYLDMVYDRSIATWFVGQEDARPLYSARVKTRIRDTSGSEERRERGERPEAIPFGLSSTEERRERRGAREERREAKRGERRVERRARSETSRG